MADHSDSPPGSNSASPPGTAGTRPSRAHPCHQAPAASGEGGGGRGSYVSRWLVCTQITHHLPHLPLTHTPKGGKWPTRPPLQRVQEVRHAGSEHRVGNVQGATHHPEHDIRLLGLGKTPQFGIRGNQAPPSPHPRTRELRGRVPGDGRGDVGSPSPALSRR